MAHYPSVQYVHFYTDGSAARKLEPITPFKKNTIRMPAQKKRKRRVLYVDPVAVLGILVAVCMVVMMAVGVAQYTRVCTENETMAAYVRYLEQENRALTEEYTGSYDLNQVKKTALALGMIPKEQVESVAIDVTVP